jgi:hypothetical protein
MPKILAHNKMESVSTNSSSHVADFDDDPVGLGFDSPSMGGVGVGLGGGSGDGHYTEEAKFSDSPFNPLSPFSPAKAVAVTASHTDNTSHNVPPTAVAAVAAPATIAATVAGSAEPQNSQRTDRHTGSRRPSGQQRLPVNNAFAHIATDTERINRASERLGASFDLVDQELEQQAGKLYMEGNYAEAEALLQSLLASRFNNLGPTHIETLRTTDLFGSVSWKLLSSTCSLTIYCCVVVLGVAESQSGCRGSISCRH